MRAHAKVNLFLHVGDRRADGYHELLSLVAFAEYGDDIIAEPAAALTLSISGPFAAGTPQDDSNIVLEAAHALRSHAHLPQSPGAALRLTKNLPPASGLGGGSADAAAALMLLNRLWHANLPPRDLAAIGVKLGADLPVCLHGQTAIMSGIGEIIEPAPNLPRLPIVLVNPAVPVPTAEIFRRLTVRTGTARPQMTDAFPNPGTFATWLKTTQNDLAAPARLLAPPITDVLASLSATPGCLLARMSGSGATCFALYESDADATNAAALLKTAHPGWWVRATTLL